MCLVLLSALCVAPVPAARAQDAAAPPPAAGRSLTLSQALSLARKNNRDLQGARERLKVAESDVRRAVAAVLPKLNAGGRLTVNEPEVLISTASLGGGGDPRLQAFNGVLQGATLNDIARQTGFTGGPATAELLSYCANMTGPDRDAVQALCNIVQNPASYKPVTAAQLGQTLERARPTDIALVPRLQLEGTITATIPLLAPPAYALIAGARAGRDSQRKNLQATEAQLLQSVASAFFAAAGTDELVAARKNAIAVSQKTLENARARLEAGVVNRVEVTRAELALIQAQQRLREAEDSRGSAYRVLDTLVLLREPFRVVPPPPVQVDPRSDGELVRDALASRPEVAALEFSIKATKMNALASGLRWLPTLAGFANMRLTNATGFAGRVDSYAFGLQLDWALFDGLERDAARQAANAQAAEAWFRLRQLKDTIADDIQTARRSLVTRAEGLKVAQRSQQLAQETLDLVRLQHDAGTATQLDLLTAQDQLVNAQVGLAQARFDVGLSDIGLRRLMGRFPGPGDLDEK